MIHIQHIDGTKRSFNRKDMVEVVRGGERFTTPAVDLRPGDCFSSDGPMAVDDWGNKRIGEGRMGDEVLLEIVRVWEDR